MDCLKKLAHVVLYPVVIAALLGGCNRVTPETFTQSLTEKQHHLQEVLAQVPVAFKDPDIEEDPKEVFESIGKDDYPWPADLVLEGVPTTSGTTVRFAFRYERGFRFLQPASPAEEKACFDAERPGKLNLQVAVEPDGDFLDQEVAVPEEVKDWQQFEAWLSKQAAEPGAGGPAHWKSFIYLLPFVDKTLVAVESTPADPEAPGPWFMMIDAEKLFVTEVEGTGKPRVRKIALCSPITNAVVDLSSGKPVLSDLYPR